MSETTQGEGRSGTKSRNVGNMHIKHLGSKVTRAGRGDRRREAYLRSQGSRNLLEGRGKRNLC